MSVTEFQRWGQWVVYHSAAAAMQISANFQRIHHDAYGPHGQNDAIVPKRRLFIARYLVQAASLPIQIDPQRPWSEGQRHEAARLHRTSRGSGYRVAAAIERAKE